MTLQMRSYKTEGIIIKRVNFSETDRILTVFTKHYGKIRAVAKGIRKITSRRGGNLEVFNWVSIFLTTGRNLDIITEVESKNSFQNIRRDLGRISLTYRLCDLIDSLCPERENNQTIFDRFLKIFFILEDNHSDNLDDLKLTVNNFEIDLLKELGYLEKAKDYHNSDINSYLEEILQRKLKSERVLKQIS